MITKQLIKNEIDNVRDEYLAILYKIIKALETSNSYQEFDIEESSKIDKQEDWSLFLDKFAGCLANDPLQRGDQGSYETRESLE